MEEERTYTQKEVEELAAALRERQETLESLECARIIMIETKQYPRFIARINHIIASIEGAQQEEEPNERIEHINNKTIVEHKPRVVQAPHIPEPEKPEKDETGQTKFKVIKK